MPCHLYHGTVGLLDTIETRGNTTTWRRLSSISGIGPWNGVYGITQHLPFHTKMSSIGQRRYSRESIECLQLRSKKPQAPIFYRLLVPCYILFFFKVFILKPSIMSFDRKLNALPKNLSASWEDSFLMYSLPLWFRTVHLFRLTCTKRQASVLYKNRKLFLGNSCCIHTSNIRQCRDNVVAVMKMVVCALDMEIYVYDWRASSTRHIRTVRFQVYWGCAPRTLEHHQNLSPRRKEIIKWVRIGWTTWEELSFHRVALLKLFLSGGPWSGILFFFLYHIDTGVVAFDVGHLEDLSWPIRIQLNQGNNLLLSEWIVFFALESPIATRFHQECSFEHPSSGQQEDDLSPKPVKPF